MIHNMPPELMQHHEDLHDIRPIGWPAWTCRVEAAQ